MDIEALVNYCEQMGYRYKQTGSDPSIAIIDHPHDFLGEAGEEAIKHLGLIEVIEPSKIVHEGLRLCTLDKNGRIYINSDVKFYDEDERTDELFSDYVLDFYLGAELLHYIRENPITVIGPELSVHEMKRIYSEAHKVPYETVSFEDAAFEFDDHVCEKREVRFAKRLLDNGAEVGIFGTHHLRPESILFEELNKREKSYFTIYLG